MDRNELMSVARVMLRQAAALCERFPDRGLMRAVPAAALPAEWPGSDPLAGVVLNALRSLRDEMQWVREGRATDLDVLCDEMSHTESLCDLLRVLEDERAGLDTDWHAPELFRPHTPAVPAY
ncbi:unnamed protein product [Gemmataceae bacterium]|nr:unnamed protein product [Gemmataceae bacterium]VTT96455.1 unnamed protein product [Gemmataceae bacterium]